MKKKIALVAALVAVTGLSIVGVASHKASKAGEAQVYLEVPNQITKESEFTVKVVVDSDKQLSSIDTYLVYDPEVLEFVPEETTVVEEAEMPLTEDKEAVEQESGVITNLEEGVGTDLETDNTIVCGTNGTIEIKEFYDQPETKREYYVTFKAKEVTTTTVSLSDVYLVDYDTLEYLSVVPSAQTFDIETNQKLSEDATLSELLIAPGTMMQEFDPNVLEYEVHVDMDVDMVGLSAIPMKEDSVVQVSMPDSLVVGDNTITITVTALSGNVNVYTVIVKRGEWPGEDFQEDVTPEEVTPEEVTTESISETTSQESEINTESTVDTQLDKTSETTDENTELTPESKEVSTEVSTEISE